MKYPQLVSTKAVNEISDWLIKRLEDLDIEHPGVYSRLLLSLLHTPFKVNAIDLLEDLKQPYRLLNKNNEELKRLAAVESLMEVSAEENKSSIVNLVDELHSKLRKIENNCEEGSMTTRTATNSVSASPISSANSKFYKNLKKIKRNHGAENATKNYYLAFPALNVESSSQKKVKQTNDEKAVVAEENVAKGESSLNLLSWSHLMSNTEPNTRSSQLVQENDKLRNAKTSRKRQRRFDKGCKRFQKNDVQFTTKRYDNATFSPKKMQMVKNCNKKHQRNQQNDASKNAKTCVNRNNNFSNSQNAPKMDSTKAGSAPWDMDFQGHWEMDRDLIGEFIQQQQQKQKISQHNFIEATRVQLQKSNEEDDMLMKCLPTKLIDDYFIDDSVHMNVRKPGNNKEALSINSFKSKFDENVKALWNDAECGNDLMKPLTHKYFEDDGSLSLASSFTSEMNSLSLFNFSEQQLQQHQAHFEVIAPPPPPSCTEIYQPSYSCMEDYDYNNNNNYFNSNPMAQQQFGGRGAILKSGSFTLSPKQSDNNFIKSGTNIQTSIWSDGDFASETESLILKEVADPNDDDDVILKKLSSIGAEMKHWQNSSPLEKDEEDVSLFNHSEKSAFKKFRPMLASTIIRANYHPLNSCYVERPVTIEAASSESGENYLTSEKTHFSPIIRDGHTFVIDNNWDEIEYERSPSGGLIHNNKRYMEWNGNGKSSGIDNNTIDLDEIENDASEFTIKFMLSENDKGCQTDQCELIKPTFTEINEEYCKRKIYDEYFKSVDSNNKWRYLNNRDDSNDYSFFSVNRVKNIETLAPQGFKDLMSTTNSSSSSICTITSSYEASAVDPFESWRSIQIENSLDSEQKQKCNHRLWEPCLGCAKNNEELFMDKPLPADRLMKDELQMDGDEIMSVIQNLYISDFCDDSEEKEEDCEEFDHVYMDMIMDETLEDESKFYESAVDVKLIGSKNQKNLTSTVIGAHSHCENLLQFENINEITLSGMQWKLQDMENDHEKYLKLLKWIQSSLINNPKADNNNNDCQSLCEVQRSRNRKRRHSTCQNLLEKKRHHSQEQEFTFNFSLNETSSLKPEDDNNLFFDAAKMLKVNIEKILLISDPCFEDHSKERNDGANYYRNILQQQHALIKHLDLSRPLTR